MDSPFFLWVLLPVLIAAARVADVSLGTLRIICVLRSAKWYAALLGFVEVMIWIVVIGQLMAHTTHLLHYAAYAAGFAAGNLIGITIEERLAFGFQTVRVISMGEIAELCSALKEKGLSATIVSGTGLRGKPAIIMFTTVRRKNVDMVLRLVQKHAPKAFVSIEDVRSAKGGFPLGPSNKARRLWRFFPFARKGK